MKKVILYKLNSEAKQEQLAEFRLAENNTVIVSEADAKKPVIRRIMEQGINDYHGQSGHLFPVDGVRFLAELQYNFKSGYLLATAILEE